MACSSIPSGWEAFRLKGEIKSIQETRYDAELASGTDWQATGLTHYSLFYSFDESGNLTNSKIFMDGRDNLVRETIPVYVDGKLTRMLNSGRSGEKESESILTEEEKDYQVWSTYDIDGQLESRHCKVFQKGLLMSDTLTSYSDMGEVLLYSESSFTYNRDGTIHSRRQFIKGEGTVSYSMDYLEYDHQGNWTRRLEYGDDPELGNAQDRKITVREIVYY